MAPSLARGANYSPNFGSVARGAKPKKPNAAIAEPGDKKKKPTGPGPRVVSASWSHSNGNGSSNGIGSTASAAASASSAAMRGTCMVSCPTNTYGHRTNRLVMVMVLLLVFDRCSGTVLCERRKL